MFPLDDVIITIKIYSVVVVVRVVVMVVVVVVVGGGGGELKPGPLFTKKTPRYLYRDSHFKPKTVVRLS